MGNQELQQCAKQVETGRKLEEDAHRKNDIKMGLSGSIKKKGQTKDNAYLNTGRHFCLPALRIIAKAEAFWNGL